MDVKKEGLITMNITKQDIMEIVGGILFAVVVILLFWLYLFATPDQFSAECEYQREQMQKGGAK